MAGKVTNERKPGAYEYDLLASASAGQAVLRPIRTNAVVLIDDRGNEYRITVERGHILVNLSALPFTEGQNLAFIGQAANAGELRAVPR
jgi:hypothetical protein